MSSLPQAQGAPAQRSLRDVVYRAHLGMALLAMVLAGTLLSLAGFLALRVYVASNLDLTARALAYTVEAALVFGDADDAQQTMARMLAAEGVAQARVSDAQGRVFAQWQRPASDAQAQLGYWLAQALGGGMCTAPIQVGGARVGQVELVGDGRGLLDFLLSALAVLLVCTLLSGWLGWLLSRRMLRDIVTPLQRLARVARAVHLQRAIGLRVPPARLAELQMLGDDFNALLQELEGRQALLEQKNAELTHRAGHDSLTELPNRASFEAFLPHCLETASASGQPMALLFLDCDGFKQINDRHGHAAGDALLVALGQRMQAQLRPGDLAARLGGDEFAIVMAAPADRAQAQAMSERLQQALTQPLRLSSEVLLQPRVSIGVALFPEHGKDMQTLLRAADTAMYHIKGHKRRSSVAC